MDISVSDVSFPKDAFMQDNFNVDRFLQESCSKSGLHKLHKELGVYIKCLQSMMIDIVNSESNSIVSLSSDLKILQNKFTNLSTPLGQLKEEVSQIYKMIDTNLINIQYLLNKKESIASQKSAKLNELRVLLSSHKISHILQSHMNDDMNIIDMEILERSVDQYIMQQMYSQLCNSYEFQSQISNSTEILNQILNNVFLKSVSEEDTNNTTRCLQMFMLMNRQSVAEILYRNKVVRPALQNIINEEMLYNEYGGDLSKVYIKIIDFVKYNMKHLLTITSSTCKHHGMSGFNFILNSAWLEINEQLKLNLSSIYAPGNPSVFHNRFTQTCTFLCDVEKCFSENNQRIAFIHHPSYRVHKLQWNLAVYFEIRQLEIIQALEENLPETSNSFGVPNMLFVSEDQIESNKTEGFRLTPCWHIWLAMVQCFHSDVYLPQLLDRFWRLNLQIISRFNTWLRTILKTNIPIVDDVPSLSETEFNPGSAVMCKTPTKLRFLCLLYLDVDRFIKKMSRPFSVDGLPYLNIVPINMIHMFNKCLEEPTQEHLPHCLSSIEQMIVGIVYTECSVHVKQISQIPRLFRKTNRSTPTVPSPYLAAMCKPADNFYDLYSPVLDKDVVKRILCSVHTRIITEYGTLVETVLTSVTKTEESLRRLKKIRSNNGNTESMSTVSDDQKIRKQVQLDVTYYSEQASMFADVSSVGVLLSLISIKDSMDSLT